MAMHNHQRAHEIMRSCRMKCGAQVPALNVRTGVLEYHPICPDCRKELDRQFRVASLQRNKQEASAKAAR